MFSNKEPEVFNTCEQKHSQSINGGGGANSGGRDGQSGGTEGSDELESGYYDSAELRLRIPVLFNRM